MKENGAPGLLKDLRQEALVIAARRESMPCKVISNLGPEGNGKRVRYQLCTWAHGS